MKKFIKIILYILIFIVLFFTMRNYINNPNDNIRFFNNKNKSIIISKGCNKSVDFTIGSDEKYYIAYDNSIQCICKNGKSYNIIKDDRFDICSIECDKDNLYFISGCELYKYNLNTKILKSIINNLPNYGDYNKSCIKLYDKYLYISIGAATNSGVVGEDNEWIEKYPYNFDIPPKTIITKGFNFGTKKTGAFVPYGMKNTTGQIISGHFPGNASIIVYDTENNNFMNYAWGIRNVKGMDVNNEGKLIAVVGGMENRGLRPVIGDFDYIYNIKKDYWYGWPDYSGGDPITSPRFSTNDNKGLCFILSKHPTTNPPAPMYQDKNLNSLKCIAIDKKGLFGNKDNIYFYNKKQNCIYYIQNKVIVKKHAQLYNNCDIANMKFYKDKLLLLDKNNGNLIKIVSANDKKIYKDKFILTYLLILVISTIIFILILNNNRKKSI